MKKLATIYAATLAIALTGSIAMAQANPTSTKPFVPIQLKPLSNAPITLHLTDESKNIYLAVGKAAGISVLFDQDYMTPRHIEVDLTNASLSDSLRIADEVTGSFYKVLAPDTILVIQNTHAKHLDFDDLGDQTFYLKNVDQGSEANEVNTAIRNLLPPDIKIFLVPSQNAIVIRGTAESLARAQRVINDLDRPKKAYRLTYTVTDVDNGKRAGTQHFAMVVASGQQSTLKQGSKVPVVTGSYGATATTGEHASPAGVQTQVTYLDIGMNFDATLTVMGNGAMLKSSIERSSLATEQSGVGPQDPIVRQTSLRGMFYLTSSKPLMLGSVDIPDSTRRLDVEVVMEQLP